MSCWGSIIVLQQAPAAGGQLQTIRMISALIYRPGNRCSSEPWLRRGYGANKWKSTPDKESLNCLLYRST